MDMTVERMILNEKRHVILTAYLQPVGGEFFHIRRRPGILILPGGGYRKCSEREADPVAYVYLKAGFQVFILEYSVGEESVWPAPLQDYEQSMELIRTNADRWHLYSNRIAVVGFSAGGHLAGCAVSLAVNKPNAAILGYAVTGGVKAVERYPEAPDVAASIDEDTCPCFIFATRNDHVVPVESTVSLVTALTAAGVAYESHIYAFGPHGVSIGGPALMHPSAEVCGRVLRWPEDSIEWLMEVFGM